MPGFAAEVLSPRTAVRDLRDKTDLYGRHGVGEYWAVHPSDRVVYVFLQGSDALRGRTAVSEPRVVAGEGWLEISAIAGVSVDLKRLFD